MTTSNPFAPAVKAQLKARVALDGPTGAGKTWTALKWATVLAGPGGKIALVDTERASSKLYAPHFTFDVASFPPPYEVPKLLDMLRAAESAGYAVVIIDSLSHFWMGEGGVLDEVDAAAQRAQGNKFAGWLTGTPLQRNLVDVILSLDMHVIVTMRSKMEYVLEEVGGKQRPKKIGMAPVQREGVEYEFTIVGDLDLDHRITITKSRCDVLADKVIQPHRETEAAETFLAWLEDGEPPPPMAPAEERAAFVDQIKAVDVAPVKAEMIGWWREMGYTSDTPLTVPELDAARGHLADLLIEHAEATRERDDFAEIDGSGEVPPALLAQGAVENPEPSSDVGEPGTSAGEGETGDGGDSGPERGEGSEPETQVSSNGHSIAASPTIAEGAGSPSGPAPSVDKPACARCGSTKAGLELVSDPGEPEKWECTIRASCNARSQLAAVGGKEAE